MSYRILGFSAARSLVEKTGARAPRMAVLAWVSIFVANVFWRRYLLQHWHPGSRVADNGFLYDLSPAIHFFAWAVAVVVLVAALVVAYEIGSDPWRLAATLIAPAGVPLATGSIVLWGLAVLVSLPLLVMLLGRPEFEKPDPNAISPYHQSLLDAGWSPEDAAVAAHTAASNALQYIADDGEFSPRDSGELDADDREEREELLVVDQQVAERLDAYEEEQRRIGRELFDARA
jgi:signal transduction histidine kinase